MKCAGFFASDTWRARVSLQQCCLAVGETILPLDLARVRGRPREHPHTCSVEHPNRRRTWTNWSESSGGHHWSWGWSTRCMRSVYGRWVCSACTGEGSGVSSEVCGDRMRSKGQKLEHGTFRLDIRNVFFTVGLSKTGKEVVDAL